jgi:hypothetical protein
LTQAELLAEAAKTEIENTRSLQLLVAIEEETKKKAEVRKRRYAGPMVRWKSRRVGDAEMVSAWWRGGRGLGTAPALLAARRLPGFGLPLLQCISGRQPSSCVAELPIRRPATKPNGAHAPP